MKNKDSKTRIQIIIGVMLFTLILTAELYIMINFPNLLIVLAVMLIADLACLYVVIDGMVVLQRQRASRAEEQYDSIFKSEKATYLMLKKYFEEIGDKMNELEVAVNLPREELVNAQKGIAKVIINRSHEDSQALMNSYEILRDQIDDFQKEVEAVTHAMNNNYEEALQLQRTTESSAEDAIQDKVKDLLLAIKDMEIRLNTAILQRQGNAAQTSPVQQVSAEEAAKEPTAKIEEPVKETKEEPVHQDIEVDLDQELDEAVRMELGDKSGNKTEKAAKAENPIPEEVARIEEELGLGSEENVVEIEEDGSDTEEVPEPAEKAESETEEARETEETIATMEEGESEGEEDSATIEETIAELEKTEEFEPEGIEALKSIMEFEPEEPDEYEELLGMESLMTPQTGSLTVMLDGSETNTGDTPEPEIEAEKSESETAETAPVAEEKSAAKKKAKSSAKKKAEKAPDKAPEEGQMPDLSDPNKSLSPDEIAALFANMGT